MTHKAVLLVTRVLQNRSLLECSMVAGFREDDEGCVNWIEFPAYTMANGKRAPSLKIRMYEKPDQKHGVIFRFEFHEGKRPYFTIEDYLRKGKEQVTYLKKTPELQIPKMDQILADIEHRVQTTIESVNHIGRYHITGEA